jgi:hypothetical protein
MILACDQAAPRIPPLNNMAQNREEQLLARVDELRTDIRQRDPHKLAQRTGANFRGLEAGTGRFELQVWNRTVYLSYPDLTARAAVTGKALGAGLTAMVIYYFHASDGTPPAEQWISFTELPDGRFYTQAFLGYTGGELLRKFRDDVQAFKRAAERMQGRPLRIGDAAYAFHLLPKVSLAVVYWLGDEDFPSSIRVLFDASVAHHLPTDACAIAGSMLTQQLLSSAQT